MRADVFQQTPLGDDVAHVGEIVQRDSLRRQDRRRHARQRRVFGAANCDAAFDRVTATDAKFLHIGRLDENRPAGKDKESITVSISHHRPSAGNTERFQRGKRLPREVPAPSESN